MGPWQNLIVLAVAIMLALVPPGPVNVIPEPGASPPPVRPPAERSPRQPAPLGPTSDGTELLAPGITFGVLGLGAHSAAVWGFLAAQNESSEGGDSCGNCDITFAQLIAMAGADPFVAAGLALTGTGAAKRARWNVHKGRKVALRPAVGWSLFAVGIATWLGGRLGGGLACPSRGCMLGVLEGTYYASAVLTFTGMGLGGHASGAAYQRRRAREQRGHVESFAFGPRAISIVIRF